MGKKRIYELAKEINVSSKQIIAKAEEKGFPVKNHMSTLGENEERQLREAFKPQAKTSHEQSAASAQPQRKVQQPRREKSQGTARTQTTAQKQQENLLIKHNVTTIIKITAKPGIVSMSNNIPVLADLVEA